MSSIRLLDAQTIDKIAAGEVVERPASVVKELLENSIDAGASIITVEIKNGGIDYIRVTDNGNGLEREDIKTAFLRHATSKIKSAEDLASILSLGFRGEALSSISAVSRVELLTKTRTDNCGVRYVIEGSRELIFEDAGVPDGTTMIVKNLFYNVPARRKFLKTAMTEGSYISEIMEHIMLSHPEISFKFIANGTVKHQTKGDSDIKSVIYEIYGRDVMSLMLPVEYVDGDIAIRGFVGKPELARNNHNYEVYFVNNRVIKSTLINRAVDEAYKAYLMLHKYPYAFLYFDIPSDMIDVNVHPTKMEIRFLEADRFYNDVVSAIKDALTKKELIWNITEDKKIEKPIKTFSDKINPEPFEKKHIEEIKHTDYYANNIVSDNSTSENNIIPSIINSDCKDEIQFEQISFLSQASRCKHKLIGQVFDTYWLVEFDSSLYIIDQHAAHEKIRYERLIKKYRENKCYSQMISPSIIITLTTVEENTLNAYSEEIKSAGFEIEHFGGNEYAICGVPNELYGISEGAYFNELLDLLSAERTHNDMDSILAYLASASCKGAIKAGNTISFSEASALIDELLKLDNPYNCPHGRPVIVSFSKSELEKKFKRIL